MRIKHITYRDEDGDVATLEDIVFSFENAWFAIHADSNVSIIMLFDNEDTDYEDMHDLINELRVATSIVPEVFDIK